VDRRNFIKSSCIACIGGITLSTIIQSCGINKIISAPIVGNDLVVPISEFKTVRKNTITFKKYIVVQNNKLQFPICIYRLSETDYSALYMRCTHQGAELQVFGDKLQCPAHGSEFSNKGVVSTYPATENLRVFPVTIVSDQIKISLL